MDHAILLLGYALNPLGLFPTSYNDAVKEHLGGTKLKLYNVLKHANGFGASIGMIFTSTTTIRLIARYNCLLRMEANENEACHMDVMFYMVIFCFIEILLSQIPDFEMRWYFSIFGASMSFTYSVIALFFGVKTIVENKVIKGNLTGTNLPMPQKLWTIFTAVGNIAFGYSYFLLPLEFKEKIALPWSYSKTVNIAALICVIVASVFYILTGSIGYAAFGDNSPANLLTEFDFSFDRHSWLLNVANFAIIVHLAGSYQVFSDPIYLFVEGIAIRKFPSSDFINKEIQIHDRFTLIKINLFRLVWRSSFVVITMIISVFLPFLDGIIGLIGAFGFFPLTVYFPMEVYLAHNRISEWNKKRISLCIISVTCLIVSIAAAGASFDIVMSNLLE
ncbi:amino acid permease 3-like [Vicia villosa]|uniref:amino acid permease 3-like n=1 Tax=Vicia villosa TaxID=3911 RepID=UPI00273BAFA7|nr:amino acid permease 3-like [Vicia villosa]